jgi:hypothetical protein
MTLLIVSCFDKTSGADGDNTPAQFLTSDQRVSGVHEKPKFIKRSCHNSSFFV